MSNKVLLGLVLLALTIPIVSAISYQTSTTSCTTGSSEEACTLTYDVNSTDPSFVVLASSVGYYGINSVVLPEGCSQLQFVTGPDTYESGYIALCNQTTGTYDFTVYGDGTEDTNYISIASYVFPPDNYSYTSAAGTTEIGSLSVQMFPKYSVYFCAGASGNDIVNLSGTNDVSDDDSAISHQTSNVCYETTADPDLALAGIGVIQGAAPSVPPFGYDCNGYSGYGYFCQSSGGDHHELPMSLSLDSGCNGSTVTVSNGGNSAHVSVKDIATGDLIASGDTSDGQFSFQGCGMTVDVKATMSGSAGAQQSFDLVSCGQCVPPKCTQDSDCATDQKCQINDNPQLNQCVPLSCACGQVAQDHQCTGSVYQCGSGANCAQCPSGQICNDNHLCVPSGCTSDLQCKDNEVCRTSSGAPGNSNTPGSCQNVTGQCGVAENHTFVPYGYECGTEPGCPSCQSGQSCVDHKCVQNDITCPSTVVVGDNANCKVTQNNQACGPADNCTTTITDPSGKQTTVPPDDAGNVLVGATIQGKYKIDLLKNGQVVKEVFVDVVPKSQPTENQPPSSAGGGVDLSLIWLLLLLLIVVGAVIYWRSRGSKK
jgi:hypothetical protein